MDDSAVLITAGFLEGRLDYKKIFDEIYATKLDLEKDGTVEVHLTGQPILAGWTFAFLPEIILILFLSLAVLLILLALYFRRFYGVIMPFTGAMVSAIWGLGFTALMGYQLEPLVLVIPMLITARAVSHSVQFVERFYEEYERLNGDKYEAIITSMAELLLPGSLAIITDAFGILVIYVSSIALMKKVAIVGAFWAMSIAVTEMLLNRLMIAYLPAPKDTKHYVPAPMVWVLDHLAWMATSPRSVRVILIVWILIVVGLVLGRAVRAGRRVAPGHADPLARQRVQQVGGRDLEAVLRRRRAHARGRDRDGRRHPSPRGHARDRGDAALHGAGPEGRRHAVDRRLPEGDHAHLPQRRPALVDGAVHAAGDRRAALPVRGGLARSAHPEPGARPERAQRGDPRVLRRPQGRHDPRGGRPGEGLPEGAPDREDPGAARGARGRLDRDRLLVDRAAAPAAAGLPRRVHPEGRRQLRAPGGRNAGPHRSRRRPTRRSASSRCRA